MSRQSLTRFETCMVLTLWLMGAAGFALILIEAMALVAPERFPHG